MEPATVAVWIGNKLGDWGLRWAHRKILKPAFAWIKSKIRPIAQTLYHAVGLATLDDLKAFSAPATTAHSPIPRTIARYGLNFRIDRPLEQNYLGRTQPSSVSYSLIGPMIHGPFCPKCHYEMVSTNKYEEEEHVRDQCVSCLYVWREEPAEAVTLRNFKLFLYRNLDAEFSKTGKLADTDTPPAASKSGV